MAFPFGVGEFWCSVDSATSRNFVWYGGATEWMRLAANGAGSGQLRINPGTVSLPGYSATTDTNTGIYFPAADTLGFVEGGSEVMRIHDTGRITIGGTTAPTFTLEVLSSDMAVNSVRVGRGAGSVATNVALGPTALNSNSTGANNVAIGSSALDINTIGTQNIAIGSDSLGANISNSSNVAVGFNSLLLNTADNNVAIGTRALDANTTGTPNVAIGTNALGLNNTGANNVAVGHQALDANTTGVQNVAIGNDALGANATNSNNVAVGHNALLLNTANDNIAVGSRALDSNTTGTPNVAVGTDALGANTTGYNNVAIGTSSLLANTTGHNNTAIGFEALRNLNGGTTNVSVGSESFSAVTTGTRNIAIGYSAGTVLTTGTSNIYIGRASQASAAGVNNEIVLGDNSTGKGNNTFFVAGSGGVYNENDTTAWDQISDLRLKKNIVDNFEGLSIVNQIKVRNFEFRTAEEITEVPQACAIKKSGFQIGVIAQEFQTVLPESVNVTSDGILSINSDRLFWHVVRAVQELSARIETLENSIPKN